MPAAVPASPLSDKHERFVQALMRNGGNAYYAYREVYPNAGSLQAVMANASRLRARQDVAERIEVLTRLAAERAVIDRKTLLQQLYALTQADPASLSSVVTEPCRDCWDDPTAAAAALDRGELPNIEAPRSDCPTCRGRGVQRVRIADTHTLSGPARLLYQGARQKSDGSIEIDRVDQLAARRELHELLGMKVSRSESKNLNVNIAASAPADLSAEDILAAYHRLSHDR